MTTNHDIDQQYAAFDAWYAQYMINGIDNNDGLFEPDFVEVGRPAWQAAVELGRQQSASAQPSLPDDWESRIFQEMERRFGLKGEENQYERLRIDDTQIGVEFALDQIRSMSQLPHQHADQGQQNADKVDTRPVAWLVSGPYQKQAFTMKSSAEAWCRGLNKGFEETAYFVSALYGEPDPAMAVDDLSDKEIIALSREMLAGKRTANMVAFARKLLARKRVQPSSGEDAKLLDWMEEQLIDTIYLDDGRIIDVGGSKQPHDVRAAIAKAMQQGDRP